MFLCDLLLLKALRVALAGTRWRVPAGGRDAVSSIGVGMLWFNFKEEVVISLTPHPC